jgi:lipopolysaccharide assembly protein B
MSTLGWLKSLFRVQRRGSALGSSHFLSTEGNIPPSQDTLSAIGELSSAVKNNPDAVEIYLALGNLFRAQGEIERAIQIRNSLIVRKNLNPRFTAKAWYELGRDYKRGGFLDRAQSAFEQARTILGDDPVLLEEMARLAADGGEYEHAARHYSRTGNITAEAHYLVRLAHKDWLEGETSASKKWLSKATKVYPGSIEAWLETLLHSYEAGEYEKLSTHLEKALERVPESLQFLLLEGILDFPSQMALMKKHEHNGQNEQDLLPLQLCGALLPVLENRQPDLLIYYYGAWLCLRCGDRNMAQNWLEKTLLLDGDFWPARLELLANSMEEQTLTLVFKGQLEFFLTRARRVKRFVCLKCGMKREQTFFVCPRCQAWHSISFRMSLSD